MTMKTHVLSFMIIMHAAPLVPSCMVPIIDDCRSQLMTFNDMECPAEHSRHAQQLPHTGEDPVARTQWLFILPVAHHSLDMSLAVFSAANCKVGVLGGVHALFVLDIHLTLLMVMDANASTMTVTDLSVSDVPVGDAGPPVTDFQDGMGLEQPSPVSSADERDEDQGGSTYQCMIHDDI
jgi:hypothetical protein